MQYVDRAVVLSLTCRPRTTLLYALVFGLVLVTGQYSVFAQAGGAVKAKTGKPAPDKNKAEKDKKVPEKFVQPDPDALPQGFRPAPEPLAIMSLDQPILSKEELAKLKKDVTGKFSRVLRDCDLSAAGKQVVKSSIRFRLAEMTQPEKRKDLPELHKTLMREITTGITSNPGIKPADVAAMLQFVNQEVVDQIPELLVNNFYVRLHAVLILSEIDFTPAHVLLLQVIQAKEITEDPLLGQPPAVKIAATQGLIRILRFTSPTVAQKTTIAHALIDELQKTNTYWWYQWRLVEGLRYVTVAVDAASNKPFVVDALIAVIKDPKREWIIRAKACYAIGRIPIPASVNSSDIVTVISDFALQLSNEAQAKPNNPIWKNCYWDVYLAFKSDGSKDKDGKDKDMDAEKRVVGGLLARVKPTAQPAYDLIVPIVRDALHGKAPAAEDVKNLGSFVKSRTTP